jgi:pyrroline-5-carboxylate reductase
MKNISFIGAGKMATALIGGLIKAGHPATQLFASCPTQKNLDVLHTRFHIHTALENTAIAAKADVIVLAVKPQLIQQVLLELRPILIHRKPLIISIAAGISLQAMHALIDDSVAIIRSMPNTPALISQGMTALYAPPAIPMAVKQQAEAIFQAVGQVLWVEDEEQLATITALSGSGPAYFFLLMEALEQVGVALGLPQKMVRQLVEQTAVGSAQMRATEAVSCAELRKQVTSKGGGTEQAIAVLESGQFVQLLKAAVIAAKVRYKEMEG